MLHPVYHQSVRLGKESESSIPVSFTPVSLSAGVCTKFLGGFVIAPNKNEACGRDPNRLCYSFTSVEPLISKNILRRDTNLDR